MLSSRCSYKFSRFIIFSCRDNKFTFFLFTILIVNAIILKAQDSTLKPILNPILALNSINVNENTFLYSDFSQDTSLTDLFPPVTKPKLLPDNISFMENFLWGENGLVRKIGIASPLTPDVRKHELTIRRTMLTAHQIGGFVTLGSMLATVYYGQRTIDGSIRQFGDMHQSFALATIISYSATALLAILSPPPLIRRDEASTISTHKTLAWIHALGMILTPILGTLIIQNHQYDEHKAHFHQVAGYITTALFATSMIVITF